MSRNPRMQGALAAATAAFCVLGLATPAPASGGGTGDLLPGPGRCAPAADLGEHFAAGHEAGGRGAPLACAASGDAGIRMTQDDAGPAETPPEEEGEEGEPLQGPADAPPAQDQPAFEGSSRPASPDLTVSEERALISSGWE